jgi:Domain of unknown function (DUF4136)
VHEACNRANQQRPSLLLKWRPNWPLTWCPNWRLTGQLAAALLLTLLAAHSACAQKVTVEFDQGADFAKYRTFAIRDAQLNSRNPALNSDLVKKRIDADIKRYLAAKGLMEVSANPDLNVRYVFGAARKAQLETYPTGWYGLGRRVVRVPYSEGTLVVDFRDPATRSLVWRAIAREDKSDPAKIEEKLGDMVKKSIEKYPPKK